MPKKKSALYKSKSKNDSKTTIDAILDHRSLIAPMHVDAVGQDLPYLGHARAVVIVCTCANTTPLNLSRTLAELGVDGIPFQQCVYGSVTYLGYVIEMDKIPDSPDTKLIQVVDVIQNAPRR